MSYIDRVRLEKEELEVRIDKLFDFLESEKFIKLASRERELLQSQFIFMGGYLHTLKIRLGEYI